MSSDTKKLFLAAILVLWVLTLMMPPSAQAQGGIVYEIEGMDNVTVREVEYRSVDGTPFSMDVYYPPDAESMGQLPVVILVNGFRDSRLKQLIGSALKDTRCTVPK